MQRRVIVGMRSGIGAAMLATMIVAGHQAGRAMVPVETKQVSAAKVPAYHLVEDGTHAATGTLTITVKTPNLAANEFLLFAAKAPVCPTQSDVTSTLSVTASSPSTIEEVAEGPGGVGRRLLRARCLFAVPTKPSTYTATLTYKATLHARHLEPGPPTMPVAPLSDAERRLFTSATHSVDFTSPDFQKWLTKNELIRRPDESDVDLGRRALTVIAKKYEYKFIEDQNRCVSRLTGAKKTDCGGAANLFVGAMRANGVPARTLVGRWAEDKTPKNDTVTHVKAEFYADGVGWVPVEAAGAIVHKNIASVFGRDNGKFLVFHIDEDMVIDTVHWKPERTPFVQGILHWATGAGTFKGMKETEEWKARAI